MNNGILVDLTLHNKILDFWNGLKFVQCTKNIYINWKQGNSIKLGECKIEFR